MERPMRSVLIGAVVLVAFTGCKTSGESSGSRRAVGMSVEEAKSLVTGLEAAQAKNNAADPLRNPASMDDVLTILKRDQIDLFPAGVAFASKDQGVQSEALRAQIELAWGEAHLLLSELYLNAASALRASLRTLETRGLLDIFQKEDTDRIEQIKKTVAQCEQIAEALTITAAEHVAAGSKLSKAVIAKSPSEYIGYRLAADYYRMRQDWENFDVAVAKIEETKPDSIGLVFLKGAAALQRDGDEAKAVSLFQDALQKDPAFTRAQVQMLLAKKEPIGVYGEFEKLRTMNANHQIVVWAGEAITAAYQARVAAMNAKAPRSNAPGAAEKSKF
jgi:tetratricopeptide (TPR) repeat protein